MDQRRLAICDPSSETREPLRNLLLGMEGVSLEAESNRYEYFRDVVEQYTPDIVIIALDSDPNLGIQLVVQLKREQPQLAILAVSGRTDGQFILQTLRSGANEFLQQPIQFEELQNALDRIRPIDHMPMSGGSGDDQRRRPTSQQKTMSKVIAIVGSRGGIGCTSLAVNLGCCLSADKNNRVVLVDLDMALGDSHVTLDVVPSYTLADVAMNIGEIDQKFLRSVLTQHESGLCLLPHPMQLDEASLVHEEHLTRLFSYLKASFTHVILDLSKSFRPTDFVALRTADMVLLVAQLELTSISNIVRLLQSMNSVEDLAQKVFVVMNRVGADEQEINIKKAEEIVGRTVFWQIPNDSRSMLGARNAGKPLLAHAPRSKSCIAIQQLADAMGGKSKMPEVSVVKKDKDRRGGGLFGIFGGGKK
jgi:pilus assembly protein CpaE